MRGRQHLVELLERDATLTVEEVDALSQSAWKRFSGFHSACLTEDSFHDLTFKVKVPDVAVTIRSPRGRIKLDVAAAHINTEHVKIEVPPPSLRGQQRSEVLAKGYQGIWHRLEETSPVKVHLKRHALRYGVAVLKIMADMAMWGDRPIRQEEESKSDWRKRYEEWAEDHGLEFPLRAFVIHPTLCAWDLSPTGPHWVIEKKTMTARELSLQFPSWDMLGRKDDDEVVLTEHWDDAQYAYVVDKQFILGPEAHPLGMPPYVILDAGFGSPGARGYPEERYQGLLKGAHDILVEESRLLSQLDSIVRIYAWPSPFIQGPPDVIENVTIDPEPGAENRIPDGVVLGNVPVPTPPPAVFQVMGMVSSMVDAATMPSPAGGERPPGLETGLAISNLVGISRQRLASAAQGLAVGIQKANALFYRWIEHVIQVPITVWARTTVQNFDQVIDPDDIKGYYTNIVGLEAVSPEDQVARQSTGLRLWQAGSISLLQAKRDYFGEQNPMEDIVQMLAERTLLSEAIQLGLSQETAQMLGIIPQIQAAAAQGGSSSPNGGPGTNTGARFIPGMPQFHPPALERERLRGVTERNVLPRNMAEIMQGAALASQTGGGPQRTFGGRQA